MTSAEAWRVISDLAGIAACLQDVEGGVIKGGVFVEEQKKLLQSVGELLRASKLHHVRNWPLWVEKGRARVTVGDVELAPVKERVRELFRRAGLVHSDADSLYIALRSHGSRVTYAEVRKALAATEKKAEGYANKSPDAMAQAFLGEVGRISAINSALSRAKKLGVGVASLRRCDLLKYEAASVRRRAASKNIVDAAQPDDAVLRLPA